MAWGGCSCCRWLADSSSTALERRRRPLPPLPCRRRRVRGVTDEQVLFGMAAAISGPNKEYGRQMKIGVETAFRTVNEAGGVHGRQLKLVTIDDGYEPPRTVEAMRDLYE